MTTKPSIDNYVYKCVNKRCPDYDKRFRTVSPSDYRRATGGPVRCPQCAGVVRLIGPVVE